MGEARPEENIPKKGLLFYSFIPLPTILSNFANINCLPNFVFGKFPKLNTQIPHNNTGSTDMT